MNAAGSILVGGGSWLRWTIFAVRALRSEPIRDPDRALIERVLSGDRHASSDLFRRHAAEVYRRLTRLVGPDPEREDLVQEAFIAAFRGLRTFRGEAVFSTWLYRVVIHVAYKHLNRRRRRVIDFDVRMELVATDPSESPEAISARREQVSRALEFLDRLKPKKRIAFVLRMVEGMSLQEIAPLVGATPAAVGQRVKHAQRELDVMITKAEQRRTRQEGQV